MEALKAAGITLASVADSLAITRCTVHQAVHGESTSRRVWAAVDALVGWPSGTAERNARREAADRRRKARRPNANQPKETAP